MGNGDSGSWGEMLELLSASKTQDRWDLQLQVLASRNSQGGFL